MKRVLTAIVLIPLVLLAVFKAPSWLFTLLVGVVALLALKEYLDLVEAYGVKPIRWLSLGVTATIFITRAWFALGFSHFTQRVVLASGLPLSLRIVEMLLQASIAVCPFVFLVVAMRQEVLSNAMPSAISSAFGIYYIALPMVAVARLKEWSWYALIFTFFAVWAGDIVAMYTGKLIGKHKMSPRISPNKTWEGAIGSVIGSVIACLLLARAVPFIDAFRGPDSEVTFPSHVHATLTFVIVAAILLNIAAQLGDLVESLIKRGANVKDSGSMLPGHGGILDRIDALLFAAPVALILFEFVR